MSRYAIFPRMILVAALVLGLARVCPAGDAAAKPSQPANLSVELLSVDDVREGMEGTGKTCLQGHELVTFNANVLGVLKGIAPGRDLVLARLSGANL